MRYFLLAFTIWSTAVSADEDRQTDYLSFAQGAIPVAIEGEQALKVGMDHALLVIDGDPGGFSLTPKPGGADTTIAFVFQLPALTTFTGFAIPNILETPSPGQTFFHNVKIEGSAEGAAGSFRELATASLETHAEKNQLTQFSANSETPIKWVRVSLQGGIDVQRDKTFFEFSEIIGYGRQEPVPLLQAFTGKWKGRGVRLQLTQDGAQVSGCFDDDGELAGTVQGNILRATGRTHPGDILSVFVLTVGDDGAITGVRSANGAPFRLYSGPSAPGLVTQCSQLESPVLGCGSVVHGIQFDFDSATIRPESHAILDALFSGLQLAKSSNISVIGHTSNEGSQQYNEQLSQRRAEAVLTALVERGIDAAGITAQGRGEDQPIADNATGAGRSLNRRVEFVCGNESGD